MFSSTISVHVYFFYFSLSILLTKLCRSSLLHARALACSCLVDWLIRVLLLVELLSIGYD